MFAVRIARLVFSFSLILAAIGAWADYRLLDRDVRAARSGEAVVRAIVRYGEEYGLDGELQDVINELRDQTPTEVQTQRLRSMVAVRAIAEAPDRDGTVQNPEKAIRDIKDSPLYRDAGVGQEGNWLNSAFRRVGDALSRIRLPERKQQAPEIQAPNLGGLGQILTVVMWVILGAVVIVFLAWSARQFTFARARKLKKIRGLLEEDEPERTADEWLVQAAQLEREGRFREAVRCLYLACLVRVDEAQIARFMRSETNWEHYHRISSSPRRPAELDFLAPTQLFDTIWYGQQTRGLPDLEVFRSFYSELLIHIEQMRRTA